MTKIENDSSLKNLRKKLRNNMPLPEIILWQKLKGSQLGYKFRRQNSIGNYVLDFYCPAKKLAIEIDGDSHFNDVAKIYDARRTDFLKYQGIKELRFNNSEIMKNIVEVTGRIKYILETTPKPLLKKEGNKKV